MRRKGTHCLIAVDDGILSVDQATYDYINKLKRELWDVTHEKQKLSLELKAIKPVLEHPDYKPAIYVDCMYCKFRVTSGWNGQVIGCRKPCVCDNFSPDEEVL